MQLIILLFISSSLFAEKPFLPAPFSHIAEKTIPAVVAVETEAAEGSGFFIGEDGHIMTNSHLLESASFIHVITHDKRSFTAKVVELDLKTDLAVIKVEGSGFSYLTFGMPDDLKIGDSVLSIGYRNAGVIGKVTDTAIDCIGLFQSENFIKTTAFVVLGDSGGPLLNDKGEVIGINAAALIDKEGTYLGKSLAISSKLATQR